jgi:hypothetical protein
VTLGIQSQKEFNRSFIRPDNLVTHGLKVLYVLFWGQTPSWLSCAFY